MEIIKPGINVNFVGRRRMAYAFSALLIIMTIVVLIAKGGPNYGIDFAGGFLVQVKFENLPEADQIRDALKAKGINGVTLQRFGAAEANEFLLRMQDEGGDLNEAAKTLKEALKERFGENQIEFSRSELVGPSVGQDLRRKASEAIFYAILFILFYISGRFELQWVKSAVVAGALMLAVYLATSLGAGVTWLIILALVVAIVTCFVTRLKFALGAVVALIHDVTITMGIFSLVDKELTLSIVAALLTIVGYSLNDTIIVFDRIRENNRKYRKKEQELVINESINETLSRTVLTSGTTLIVLLCLFILGGPVIHDFAFAMIVGIMVGTYSSIFVASPILLLWPNENTGKGFAKKSARRR